MSSRLILPILLLLSLSASSQEKFETEYGQLKSAWNNANYIDVVKIASTIINKDSSEENAWRFRTYAYSNLNAYKNAYAGYRKLVSLDPEYVPYYIGASWYAVLVNENDSAITYSTEAISKNGYSYAPILNKAHALLRLGRYYEAGYYYDIASEMITSETELERGPLADFHLLDSLFPAAYYANLNSLFRENFALWKNNKTSNSLLDSILIKGENNAEDPSLADLKRKFIDAEEKEKSKRTYTLTHHYFDLARLELYGNRAFTGLLKKSVDYALANRDSLVLFNIYTVLYEDMLNLRPTYGEKKMEENAEYFAEEAVSVAEIFHMKNKLPTAYFNLGEALNEQGKHKEALEKFKAVLPVVDSKTQPFTYQQTLNRLVLVHASLSNIDSARLYTNKLLEYFKSTGEKGYKYFMARKNFATILINEKKWDAGLPESEKLLAEFANAKGFEDELSALCRSIGDAYANKGNKIKASAAFENALKYYRIYFDNYRKENGKRTEFISNTCSNAYQYLKNLACEEGRADDFFRLNEESRENLLIYLITPDTARFVPKTLKQVQQTLTKDDVAISFSNGNDAKAVNSVAFTSGNQQLHTHLNSDLQQMVKNAGIDVPGTLSKVADQGNFSDVAYGYTSRFLPLLYFLQNTSNTTAKRSLIRKKSTADTITFSKESRMQVSRLLYDFYISPYEKLLEGKKTLYICSDLMLNYIPFETLIDHDGHYLAERFDIIYVPGFTIQSELKKRTYNDQGPILAFGNADYKHFKSSGVPGSELDNFSGSWSELEGTAKELNMIGEQLKGSEIYDRENVSESKIKALSDEKKLANASVLHFALHGVGSILTGEKDNMLVITEPAGSREDGYLKFYEAYQLDVKSRLVTLSACETAFGTPTADGSSASMVTAFLASGAGSCVGTNWKVSDEATAIFMKEFYSLAARGIPYPQALAQVKRRFIKGDFGSTFQLPFYWAPFKYYGF